ncbi:MAG: peptidoglycan-binding LysM [Microgenomates group bacterium Gr01-1014_5]|nr:MAG: peptidoglycan-binding LysM [Microgenomates group bacterium Gr01-1014_5]
MDLKATLKAIKINEPTLSTILGAFVILAVGILVINYFRTPGKTGSITPPAQTTAEEAVSQAGTKHTVASGEHLWRIAQKYYKSGYNWVDIAEANNLTNPDLLTVGAELTIPSVPGKQNTVNAPPGQTATSGEPIQTDTYSVVQGDALWSIAVRAYGDGYQWPKIWEANRASILNPNLIYPDQNLTLPRQ